MQALVFGMLQHLIHGIFVEAVIGHVCCGQFEQGDPALSHIAARKRARVSSDVSQLSLMGLAVRSETIQAENRSHEMERRARSATICVSPS